MIKCLWKWQILLNRGKDFFILLFSLTKNFLISLFSFFSGSDAWAFQDDGDNDLLVEVAGPYDQFSFLFQPPSPFLSDRSHQVGAGNLVPGGPEIHREPVMDRRRRCVGVHEHVRLEPRQI